MSQILDDPFNHYPYSTPCNHACVYCDESSENFDERYLSLLEQKKNNNNTKTKKINTKNLLHGYDINDYLVHKSTTGNIVYTDKDFHIKKNMSTIVCTGEGDFNIFLPVINKQNAPHQDIYYDENGLRDNTTFSILNLSLNDINVISQQKDLEIFLDHSGKEFDNLIVKPYEKMIIHKYINTWRVSMC